VGARAFVVRAAVGVCIVSIKGGKIMEYLKKHWSHILFVVGAVTLAGLLVTPLLMSPTFNFLALSQILGLILFFLGVATYYALKLASKEKEDNKLAKAITLLVTGLLTITFLSIGLAGFSKDSDKAEGALGNAYAYYKSSEAKLETAKANLATLQGADAKLTALYDGIVTAQAQASAPDATPLATFLTGIGTSISGLEAVANPSNEQIATLARLKGIKGFLETVPSTVTTVGLAKRYIDGYKAETVKTYAELKAQIADYAGDTELAKIETAQKSAKTGAVAVMFTYLTTMLALGLGPVVKGARKLCCSCKAA